MHVDRNDQICKLLISDVSESLNILEDLLMSTPVGVVYDRLLTAATWSISIGYGSGNPPPFWKKDILTKAWEMHQDGLLTLADDLASAPYRPTSAMLKVSVLKWKRGGIPKNNAPAPALTEPQSQIQQEMRTLSLSKFATMVKSKLDMQQI